MPSAWITHVKTVYAKGKKNNTGYTYGQAMKDAKKTYKRGGASAASEEVAAPKKRRGRKKKSRKSKKSVEEDDE
jgi:hypothetical protein